jgi:drug/metabolite transporter (DMT)-like permease
MITLGILLIVLYFFFRHPVFYMLGGLLLVLGIVLFISAAGHYAYY